MFPSSAHLPIIFMAEKCLLCRCRCRYYYYCYYWCFMLAVALLVAVVPMLRANR